MSSTVGPHAPPAAEAARAGEPEAVLAALRARIDELLDALIPRGRPVALLHYPYDANVGNHMMWVAATDYLRSRRIRIGYVAHAGNLGLESLRRAIGRGPILFLGGVTISRLWPGHGDAKRLVAAAFPENPLVSLPATMLFADEGDRRQARDMFGGHSQVTLLARDPVSAAQAREVFPASVRVETVPDLALRLPAQPRRSPRGREILWLARNDLEGSGAQPPSRVRVFDWPRYTGQMGHCARFLKASGAFSWLRRSTSGAGLDGPGNAAMAWLYRRASLAALAYGNEVLDEASVLVTDRMHPHVLAALRGQDVVLLPDRYGKNHAVYESYTHGVRSVHWADTPSDAFELARALADR